MWGSFHKIQQLRYRGCNEDKSSDKNFDKYAENSWQRQLLLRAKEVEDLRAFEQKQKEELRTVRICNEDKSSDKNLDKYAENSWQRQLLLRAKEVEDLRAFEQKQKEELRTVKIQLRNARQKSMQLTLHANELLRNCATPSTTCPPLPMQSVTNTEQDKCIICAFPRTHALIPSIAACNHYCYCETCAHFITTKNEGKCLKCNETTMGYELFGKMSSKVC